MSKPLDIEPLLDAEIVAGLAKVNLGFATLSLESLQRLRKGMAAMPAPPVSDAVARTDHRVAGRPPVAVRMHRAKSASGKLPCIYWMHGGGLVLGTHTQDDQRFDRWCPLLNCVGASVDYGLAPESTYPAPLEDCYAGLLWLFEHADEFGIDSGRIGLGGSSAGAGLAAALALLARDRGDVNVAFQALLYPMIDDRQLTVSSQWADPVWPPQANRFGWDSYLGAIDRNDVPIYAAAARATNLVGLPPTFICVGALDGFSDEDIDYATRLRHAGVPCELHVYPGAPHGFDALLPDTAIARRGKADMERWLAAQFSAA